MVDQSELYLAGRVEASEEFDEFTMRVERLWSQLRLGRIQQPQYSPRFVRPAIDIYQTEDAVVVAVEAPGMRNQELRLELDGGQLTISGEKLGKTCTEAGVFSQLEISRGPFSRTVQLPAEVDPDAVTLSYDDGYIEIRLPRVARRLERRVRITLRQP
ncbi:MAG TPA: Hsp20/alpha crystallin family protein [Dehalococcoidia bacterium]|nr:Hsp20/alpha crystallin family protein [Dehalococcoidia bacterium]